MINIKEQLELLKEQNFSLNEQILFRGIVEDNNDPDKIGRVRVRVYGVHSQDKTLVKTEELPWSEVIGDNGFGLVAGVGLSSVLRVGTWVWVMLEMGDFNKPVVIGTIAGINSVTSDHEYPFESRSKETDINRLARAEKLDEAYNRDGSPTAHNKIESTLDIQTGITDGVSGADVSQSEPSSLDTNTQYPNASVIETHSGHILQFDDTEGNERIRLFHRTGSYIEIRPDGSIVQKSMNEDSANHYIHMSEVHNHIKKSVKTYIEENLDEIIKGNVKRYIDHNLKEHISGAFKITADGNIEINNSVKIIGDLDVTGESSDGVGNLSSLRDAYNAHYHIGNLGIPTAPPTATDPEIKTTVTVTEK